MKRVALWLPVLVGLLSLLSLNCLSQAGGTYVTEVIDGDTIVVTGGYHVRYIGVDTPEKGEVYYLEAKLANRDMVWGKKLVLEKDVSETDRYGRWLRYVYSEKTFVNLELVRQGYARARDYPPDTKYQLLLEAAEKEAKLKHKGIWQ